MLTSSDYLRALYLASAFVIVSVFVVHSSLLCLQIKRQDTDKKQHVLKSQYPVDHLVANSKLTLGTEAARNQLRFYTKAERAVDGFPKIKSASCSLTADTATADVAMSDQATLADKPSGASEALDPKLVLPLRETWYAVKIEQVLKNDGCFEIVRITGCPSLRACVSYSGGCGGVLELFSCSGGATTQLLGRCSSQKAPRSPLALADADGRCLGKLRPTSSERFELTRHGDVVFTLVADDSGQLELSTAGGSRLACVSFLAGHLGICVNAGADTGLIMCLVLSAVLLGGAASYVLPKSGNVSSEDCHENVACAADK